MSTSAPAPPPPTSATTATTTARWSDGALIDTGRRKFGAIVGDGVHTGINTSIYPGRKLWPGTTTRPGEIVSRDVI